MKIKCLNVQELCMNKHDIDAQARARVADLLHR